MEKIGLCGWQLLTREIIAIFILDDELFFQGVVDDCLHGSIACISAYGSKIRINVDSPCAILWPWELSTPFYVFPCFLWSSWFFLFRLLIKWFNLLDIISKRFRIID